MLYSFVVCPYRINWNDTNLKLFDSNAFYSSRSKRLALKYLSSLPTQISLYVSSFSLFPAGVKR